MKLKGMVSACFLLLTLTAGAVLGGDADSGITGSSPHFYAGAGGDREGFLLEAGIIKGQVTENNQTQSPQPAVLLLALYDKTNGLMKHVEIKKFDGLAPGATPVFHQIEVSSAANGVLRAFVWNNADDNSFSMSRQYEIFDVDIAPDAPKNMVKKAATYRTLNIAWDEAYDNLGISEYRVYRNDTLVSSPKTASFTDTGLNYGTAYQYKIKAVDLSGNESAFSQEFSASTNDVAWCVFGANNLTHLLDKTIPVSAAFTEGFYSEVAMMGPADDIRECRKIEFIKPYNGNNDGAANYLMIGVDRNYIKAGDRSVTVKLTYLDIGTDTIAIEYGSTASSYTKMSVAKTNTGRWATSVFHITDADFTNRQIGGQYDLRVQCGESNTAEYVHKMEIFNGLDS